MWTGQETANVIIAVTGLVTAVGGVIKFIELNGKVNTANAKSDAAMSATSDLRGTADQHDAQITDMSGRVATVEAAVNLADQIGEVVKAVQAANADKAGAPASATEAPATSPATDSPAPASP